MTDQRPLGKHQVRPWLAETFPALFQDWRCAVTALELDRTFWEKATILHAEHHRPEDYDMRPMFLTEPQTFAELIRILTNAEQRINEN